MTTAVSYHKRREEHGRLHEEGVQMGVGKSVRVCTSMEPLVHDKDRNIRCLHTYFMGTVTRGCETKD